MICARSFVSCIILLDYLVNTIKISGTIIEQIIQNIVLAVVAQIYF